MRLRDEKILQRRQRRQQVELLQHDADVTAAETVALRRRERSEILPVDLDPALGWREQSGNQVEQRGLAAARGADDEGVALGASENASSSTTFGPPR